MFKSFTCNIFEEVDVFVKELKTILIRIQMTRVERFTLNLETRFQNALI